MRQPFIEAGEIVSTHGVHGECKVLPWVDSPEFLLEYSRVRIDGKEYAVESCRVQKTCNLYKLRGIDTVEDAQKLRGKTVELYREDTPSELIFSGELIGMHVFAGKKEIGLIREVLDYPGNKVYIVKGTESYMIPAVKAYILSTDIDSNVMNVKLIEGMRFVED